MLSEKTNAHSDCINSVAFSPDGTKIVSGSDDKTIKVWELRDQPVGERTFVASKEEPTVIKEAYMNGCTPMSINGITVTSWEELRETFNEAEGQVTIKVWDLAGVLGLLSEKTNAHASGDLGSISCVQFSPDGSKIVSCGITDGVIKVWDSGAPRALKNASKLPLLGQN